MILNRTRAVALTAAALTAAGTVGAAGVMSASSKDSSNELTPGEYGYGDNGYGGPGQGGFGHRSRAGGPGGPGHRGGPRQLSTAQLAKIVDKLGVSSTELKSAIAAVRKENKPTAGDRRDRGRQLAAALAAELGVSADDVQKIVEEGRPQRPQTPPPPGTKPEGGKPGQSALVAALAKGLGKDEATVETALQKVFGAGGKSDRSGHRDAEFAALAKKLGLKADDVKAAFESVLPKRPTFGP